MALRALRDQMGRMSNSWRVKAEAERRVGSVPAGPRAPAGSGPRGAAGREPPPRAAVRWLVPPSEAACAPSSCPRQLGPGVLEGPRGAPSLSFRSSKGNRGGRRPKVSEQGLEGGGPGQEWPRATKRLGCVQRTGGWGSESSPTSPDPVTWARRKAASSRGRPASRL